MSESEAGLVPHKQMVAKPLACAGASSTLETLAGFMLLSISKSARLLPVDGVFVPCSYDYLFKVVLIGDSGVGQVQPAEQIHAE